MTLQPSGADTGIRFRRVDVSDGNNEISARYDCVVDTVLCTAIANRSGVKVATVEHLMAALSGMAIDNVIIELDAPEVPIMDGSAAPFVFLIECAGVSEQPVVRRSIQVLKPIVAVDGESYCRLTPSRGFSISFEIKFDSDAVSRSDGFFDLHNGAFKHEICRARTFGFERDVRKLRDQGLARGGSLENAVVIGADDEILNHGGLRYQDEFVRHKVLDSIGDLYLAGGPILAHFEGVCSGHALNNRLLRALFAEPSAWRHTTDVARPSFNPGQRLDTPAIA